MRLVLFLVLLMVATPITASDAPPTILVLGDSISAGYGVAEKDGWVARLDERLAAENYPHRVVNASITGDTSSGGLARLPKALDRHEPAIVVIELGGNDGLRGQPLDAMRRNLQAMIDEARAAGARVLLLGIRLPPNYGRAYIDRFIGVYEELADTTGVALVPRVLAGVGERREHMQDDGIHPNAAGHEVILDNVWPTLLPLIEATAEPA
ncbi:MAG: arylesterase [Halofilum sp. (in: g-proteobacteria)]